MLRIPVNPFAMKLCAQDWWRLERLSNGRAYRPPPQSHAMREHANSLICSHNFARSLANELGLRLDYSRNLPDIILTDALRDSPKVIFVEVVATDGAVTEQRKQALLRIALDARFTQANVYFLTAFLDRSAPAFRRLVPEIAWGTFAWFSAEPEKLIAFREGKPEELSS